MCVRETEKEREEKQGLNILVYVSVTEMSTGKSYPTVFLRGNIICQNNCLLMWVMYCFPWDDSLGNWKNVDFDMLHNAI